MNGMLRSGTLLISDSGTRYKVLRLLGSGGQGEVYEVSRGADKAALKWYFPRTAIQKHNLERLIAKGCPDSVFLWPEDLITQGVGNTFGYVMRLRPDKYKGIADMMKRRAEPSFTALCRAAFNLTQGYQKLHSLGYCYRDISFGNVFFDPKDGDILICDNDNISASGADDGTISGTPRFMAPEIVVGAAKPSRNTDLYSLSVLLFYMLMLNHPLEGKLEADIKCMDIFAMERLFGKDPVFIFDPNDTRNRPVKGYQDNAVLFWQLYPQFLRELFTAAFTTGLTQPSRRVTENQWLDALSSLLGSICVCRGCGAEVFTDSDYCWCCGDEIPETRFLTVEKRRVALSADATLYSHMLFGDYDIGRVVARVVRHPNDPDKLGIRNETSAAWVYTRPDGSETPVPPEKSAAIVEGARLSFGKTIGAIT